MHVFFQFDVPIWIVSRIERYKLSPFTTSFDRYRGRHPCKLRLSLDAEAARKAMSRLIAATDDLNGNRHRFAGAMQQTAAIVVSTLVAFVAMVMFVANRGHWESA